MTPLHHFGEWLRELLQMIPLGAVRFLFLLIPLSLLAWVLTLPKRETVPHADAPATANLRIWASVALLIQILIYIVF